MKKFIAITLCLAALASCTKKAETDTTAPSITISTPTEGQYLMQMTTTDSSTLSAHITDQDLHAYSILIMSASGTDTLLNVPETHQEVNDLTITKKFPLHVVSDTVAYKVIMTAVDHSSNEGQATRNFFIYHM